MRVSIVITNYNYGSFLQEAIDSCLRQTHSDTETIVVDDGSTDNSVNIARSYGERIKLIVQPNAGQTSACNAGFAAAAGDIIIFLDSDDVLLPDAAAQHVTAMNDPAVVKSCGLMQVIDQDGADTGTVMPRSLPDSGDYRLNTLRKGIDNFRVSFTSGQAWSRSFLQQVMPLPREEATSVDGYLTAIDRLFGPLAFIHEPVVRYRCHDANKGPIRFRFERDFLRQRLSSKRARIQIAEQWARKLGYQFDNREFRRIRDWRITLMQHSLYLMGDTNERLSAAEFISSPLRNAGSSRLKALLTSTSLALVWLLPTDMALSLAQSMLERTQAPGPRILRRFRRRERELTSQTA